MKKQYKIILIIILIHTQVLAQLPHSCDSENYKTNPLSPIDLRGQPYINEITPGVPKFDWLQEWLPNYFENAPPNQGSYTQGQLLNPYWNVGNSNLYHLAHQNDESFRDYKPEDGWELITFSLGTYFEMNPQNELEGKRQTDNHPYFILYNKFTGILRIFVYYNKQFKQGYSTGYIKLYPIDEAGNRAALFQHFEVNTRPLVAYDAEFENEGTVVNRNLTLGHGQWMYADFAMSYDACVCEFEYSDILFDAYVIENAQIDMSGFLKLHTTGNMLLNIDAKSDIGGGSNNPFFQSIGKASKAGQTGYKTTKAIVTIVAAAAVIASKGTATPLVMSKLMATKAAKEIPYVGGAIGIIDFLVGGTKKTTTTGKAKGEVVLTTHGDITLTGGIINDEYLIDKGRIHVPGSKLPASPQSYNAVPKYSEPLGVFRMLEPPLIKYVEYRDNMSSNAPRVRQYKVDELPIFKLNPSSGLEIEEMKVSLVLDYGVQYNNVPGEFNVNTLNFTMDHNHPVIFSESPPLPGYQADPYIEYEKMGFNLEKEFLSSGGSPESVRLTLGQIPIGCFENTSFYLSKEANSSEELVLKIRFNLILKEKLTGMLHQAIHIYNIPSSYIIADEDHDDTYEFLYYTTHEPESWGFETRRIIPFSNSVFSSPNSSLPSVPSYYQEKNTNILDYLIWEDEIVPEGTYKAWELISIGNNVTLQGNSSFYSYGEIFITPENQFTPEKKFSTIFPDAGCYENPMDYNTEDVSSFCENNNKYKPYRHKTEPNLDLDTTPIVKSFDFKLYPNPTSRMVNVELPEVVEGGVYDIKVMDIRGQILSEVSIRPSETVGSVYEMDVSHLNAGIYFVRLQIDGEAKVKRLVIL
jgi:hypothetical protein